MLQDDDTAWNATVNDGTVWDGTVDDGAAWIVPVAAVRVGVVGCCKEM